MKKNIFYCALIIFLMPFAALQAQEEDKHKENTGSFKLGVFYNSSLNYYGRTDSLKSSGIFPLAEIWFNKSFYLNGAPVFVNNSTDNFQYSGTVITLGYLSKSLNEKTLTHLFVTKPLYKDNSNLVQSALKIQASGNFSMLNKYINLNLGGDIKLSDKVDFGISGGIDHLFRLELPGGVILVIDPSAYVYAGTQQFTKTYYKKSNYLFFPAINQQVSQEVSRLNILSYELSMPVVLAKNKVQVILNPAYVIPQNLINVENRPDLSERGKDMFYMTMGAKITF